MHTHGHHCTTLLLVLNSHLHSTAQHSTAHRENVVDIFACTGAPLHRPPCCTQQSPATPHNTTAQHGARALSMSESWSTVPGALLLPNALVNKKGLSRLPHTPDPCPSQYHCSPAVMQSCRLTNPRHTPTRPAVTKTHHITHVPALVLAYTYLCLAVRAQPGASAVLADLSKPAAQLGAPPPHPHHTTPKNTPIPFLVLNGTSLQVGRVVRRVWRWCAAPSPPLPTQTDHTPPPTHQSVSCRQGVARGMCRPCGPP